MKEINFNVEDIEKIDLSMDVGVKEIYPPIENLEVTPSKEQQVFNHENSYGYDEVIVNPIPDEYIIPDGTLNVATNGDVDVTMFRMARVGVYTPPNLQDKELTINENGTHEVIADEEYDGLSKVSVTVDAIEDLTEELTTYNNELTEQETSIDEIIETLKDKGVIPSKYAPRYISFYNYDGSSLDKEMANLDTSNMENMSRMFYSCPNLTSLDLSQFNTSKAKEMVYMFFNCRKLTTLDLSNFDTSNVTTMQYMFNDCMALTFVNLTGFDTSNVTTMLSMFDGCNKLETLDISHFNIDKVTTIQAMFYECMALTTLNLPSSTGEKITNCYQAFYKCLALTSIDLSAFVGANVTNVQQMFQGCSGLTSIDMRNFNPTNLTACLRMFMGCTSLKYLDIRSFDIAKITSNFTYSFSSVPTDCEIIVADDTQKAWFTTNWSSLTNVKTVAELEVA